MPILSRFPRAGARAVTFESCSWEELSAISRAGEAAQRFAVGDTREVTLGAGDTAAVYQLAILGFEHDDLVSGGKAGMTIGFSGVLDGKYKMHNVSTNTVSWEGTTLRATLQSTIWEQLPAALRAVIRPVYKWTVRSTAQPDVLVRTEDTLWLLAEAEVFSRQTGYAGAGEGTVYPYFDDDARLIKRLRTGTAVGWWIRSPAVTAEQYADRAYCYCTKGGNAYWYLAERQTQYLSPCFCI